MKTRKRGREGERETGKTTGQGTKGRKEREAAARRSLAASKANWTRAVRRAFPEGGPLLATKSQSADALQYELTRRAFERGRVAIAVFTEAIACIQAKQIGRQREMAVCALRELAAKEGAR